MKVNSYQPDGSNTGKLRLRKGQKTTNYEDGSSETCQTDTDEIIIKKGRWIEQDGTSNPMKYNRINCFENRYVYFLHDFGDDSGPIHHGKHIVLNWWQNIQFLWMQQTITFKIITIALGFILAIANFTDSIVSILSYFNIKY